MTRSVPAQRTSAVVVLAGLLATVALHAAPTGHADVGAVTSAPAIQPDPVPLADRWSDDVLVVGSAAASELCESADPAPFDDREAISPTHRSAVDCLTHHGVITGRTHPDGTLRFAPAEPVTRAQLTGMLARVLTLAGVPLDTATHPATGFLDVPADHPFHDEIAVLSTAGIVAGVEATRFAPGRPVRRDQTATLLVRAAVEADAALPVGDGPSAWFADVTGGTHRDAIMTASLAGLVRGVRSPCAGLAGRFDPRGTVTREQAASLLVRLLVLLERGAVDEAVDPDQPCAAPVWRPDLTHALAYASRRPGVARIAAVGTDGILVGHRSEQTVPAASLMKLLFLAVYLDQPDVRGRALTSTEQQRLGAMIRESADEPATWIANRVGPEAIRRYAAGVGLGDLDYTRPWGLSQMSARDLAAWIPAYDHGIPQRHRQTALSLLTEVVASQRHGLDDVEAAAWQVHVKGGWGGGTGAVNHQVVLLEHVTGTRIALVVLLTDSPDDATGQATLAGITARVLADLP